MSARTITSATIDTYLKLLRRPADVVIARLPAHRTLLGPTARVIVDQLDAAVRTGLAATLSDDMLRAGARRREQATRRRGRPSAAAEHIEAETAGSLLPAVEKRARALNGQERAAPSRLAPTVRT